MDSRVTSLISAAKNAQAVLVRKALDDGADPDAKDVDGVSVLHHAVWKGNKETVQMLLNEKIDPNAKDNDGRTPLSWAAERGCDKAVELLLRFDGIDPNATDKEGKTPIAWAAQCGSDRVAKALLGWDGIDPNATDMDGSTPLMWAACRGKTAVAKLLLGWKGIKPNEKDKDGSTALSWAASRGYNAVVKVLLGWEGIEPNEKDKDGLTALSWAALRGWDGCVKTLLGWDGIDANTQDNNDETPLLWAACRGQAEAVRLLLAHDGINPDLENTNGRTPLSWAADRGYDAVVSLLIDHNGVDIQRTDKEGSTPLLWASCHGHEAVVSLLIEKGADMNIGDENDRTPLDWAKSRGYEAVVELLQSAAEAVEFEKKIAVGKLDGSDGDGDRKDFHPLPVRPNLKFYLFDDKTTEFSQRTIDAADEWMKQYENLLRDKIEPIIADEETKDAKASRVKVAGLDSGLDWTDSFIRGAKRDRRIAGFKNFAGDREDIAEKDGQCVDDDFGHGTHITALLLRTSLGTDVYITRISKEGKLGDPEHVAEAIMWATDVWEVDVISMSLGFNRLDLTVSDAIKHAYAQDVIMLAAAANHGGNASITFPANQHSMVLGINSTDGLGNPSTFTPSPGPLRENYSVLGEGVSSQWPKKLGGPSKRKAGTSFATPIATGIAATLLYYAKVKFPKREGSKRFGSVGKMRAILSAMVKDRVGYEYLVPVSFFETNSDRLVYEMLYNIWTNND